jgi:large subunit ribosomal protein L4e
MFAPTKIWRRWHVKINVNQKRFAVCAALAATALPALVMARGHKVENVPEIPLVVSNESIDGVIKTSKAVALLKALKAHDDVDRIKDGRKIRPGKGKMRNRRYVQGRGPLVVFNQKSDIVKAFRNLPGVELVNVNHLNLLQLAPGGHLGRFVIWTKDAFEQLDTLFGTYTKKSAVKKGFVLPRPLLSNADLGRLINSDEIQSVVRPVQKARRFVPHKKNPLVNIAALVKLNPYAQTLRRKAIVAQQKRDKKSVEVRDAKKKGTYKAPKPTANELKIKKLQQARRKNRPAWAAVPAPYKNA